MELLSSFCVTNLYAKEIKPNSSQIWREVEITKFSPFLRHGTLGSKVLKSNRPGPGVDKVRRKGTDWVLENIGTRLGFGLGGFGIKGLFIGGCV